MANKRKFQENFVQNMLKNHKGDSDRPCRFTAREITSLLDIFMKFTQGCSNKHRLERVRFRDELHKSFQITDDFLMDRIFRAFDKGSKGYLKPEDFVCGLSCLLVGTLNDQMKYCFQVYDLNSDGYISREEMFHLLKSTLVKSTEEDPDEGVKDLVETALKKLDCDHDGRVSFPDFQQAVRQDALMLECLGNCLPNQVAKKEFLQIVRGETEKRY
ncbi:hypothetical protein RRG08_009695 [Elysia crispata]|uniref:EF-hand domain-containing protein n=1 Tax=Elysia crispata TaxID=231223 RepID=A0AAE1CMY9_9GAST|nr:hypothetical protein RRG08_009695 [Elysia crispata]